MMQALEIALGPIVAGMGYILNFYSQFFSVGASILFLSFTFSVLLIPFQKFGVKMESKVSAKLKIVNEKVQKLKDTLRGEELFLATEKIYKEHNYHPIQNVMMGAEFFAVLPILVSAILLFTKEELLTGQSFLIIKDLSQPDQLVASINILPFVMFIITFTDSILRYRSDKSRQNRFLFISFLLLILVYNLPSGLIIYWIGNNLVSFAVARGRTSES